MSELCYICGDELIPVPKDHKGPLLPKHCTRDHVPPQGLFIAPKPDNLICVTCCNACNGEQSNFDERFRFLLASQIDANAAGKKIMIEKVIGSTMAKARQREFVTSVVSTMRDETVKTPAGTKEVSAYSVRADEIYPGVIRITKGLLASLHPEYDYRGDGFVALDISAGSLAKADAPAQLALVAALVTKTNSDQRGNNREFRFWRQVESNRGVWLLEFYEAMKFVVQHDSGKRGK